MHRKIFVQCSNCGYHFKTSPAIGVPEGMYYMGYRAVGSALYCPECLKTWKDRNGAEFYEQYENPLKMFANWWNDKVRDCVKDKSKIKTYRIVNGVYEEVKGGVSDAQVIGNIHDNPELLEVQR